MNTNVKQLQLVAVPRAAGVLGIKENTLRQWLCYGRFPYVKVGRRTMVAVEDLRRFVERNRVEPLATRQLS